MEDPQGRNHGAAAHGCQIPHPATVPDCQSWSVHAPVRDASDAALVHPTSPLERTQRKPRIRVYESPTDRETKRQRRQPIRGHPNQHRRQILTKLRQDSIHRMFPMRPASQMLAAVVDAMKTEQKRRGVTQPVEEVHRTSPKHRNEQANRRTTQFRPEVERLRTGCRKRCARAGSKAGSTASTDPEKRRIKLPAWTENRLRSGWNKRSSGTKIATSRAKLVAAADRQLSSPCQERSMTTSLRRLWGLWSLGRSGFCHLGRQEHRCCLRCTQEPIRRHNHRIRRRWIWRRISLG